MRKLVFLVLAVLVSLSFCSCNQSKPAGTPEQLSEIPKGFYPTESDSQIIWNEERNLEFRNENKIYTVSYKNEIIRTVTLPKEHLPKEYFLSWSSDYIVAFSKTEAEFYCLSNGDVAVSELYVFDRDGNFLYEVNDEKPGDPAEILYSDKFFIGFSEWIGLGKIKLSIDKFFVVFDLREGKGQIVQDLQHFEEINGEFYLDYDQAAGEVYGEQCYYVTDKSGVKTLWRSDGKTAEAVFEIEKGEWPVYIYPTKGFALIVEQDGPNYRKLYRLDYENEESYPKFTVKLYNKDEYTVDRGLLWYCAGKEPYIGQNSKLSVMDIITGEITETNFRCDVDSMNIYKIRPKDGGFEIIYTAVTGKEPNLVYSYNIYNTVTDETTALLHLSKRGFFEEHSVYFSPDGFFAAEKLYFNGEAYIRSVLTEEIGKY